VCRKQAARGGISGNVQPCLKFLLQPSYTTAVLKTEGSGLEGERRGVIVRVFHCIENYRKAE
jgi:hypothetical protein